MNALARFVHEVMNREFFSLRPGFSGPEALESILDLGIAAAPVLDDARRPLGLVSLHDLAGDVGRSPTPSPPVTIDAGATLSDAARLMADEDRRHLVVVDDHGRAVGMLSSVDLLLALLDLTPKHRPLAKHREQPEVSWTPVAPLDTAHIDAAPDGPGVLVLSSGGAGRGQEDLWVEQSPALRARVADLVELPQGDSPMLQQILRRADLGFRCAPLADPERRSSLVEQLHDRIDHMPTPRCATPLDEAS